jgi:regulator of protease activity HflC (stomatin/prohibitin superfamily)
MKHAFWLSVLMGIVASGCVVVNQGEVGLRRVWGRIDPVPLQPGIYSIEPVSTTVLHVPTRTTTLTLEMSLPSKEGMNVRAVMSILYRVEPHQAAEVISRIGEDYAELIAAVFRSQAADVSARFFARDMYSAERSAMESAMRDGLRTLLSERGFAVEAVLMKSINLPDGLANAIENKLEAEQQAQQMRFTIERERLEAERKRIEAEGVRDAQRIVGEGLSPSILRLRQIEALRELARSPNARLVVMESGGNVTIQTPAP